LLLAGLAGWLLALLGRRLLGWLGRKLLARLARWPIWASNPCVIQLSNEYNYIFFFASCPKQSRVKNRYFHGFSQKKSK